MRSFHRRDLFCGQGAFALVLWLGSYAPLLAQTATEPAAPPASLSTRVDHIADQVMARQRLVGLAVGIVDDGQVVHLSGHGFEDREAAVPVSIDTRFRWASISKSLTAIAAMRLVERGKLDLDADCRDYVPEFPDHGPKIRLRHLLSHQSGIVHYSNGQVVPTVRQYGISHPHANVILALDTFNLSPLLFAPGERFSYTTHGYILASAVVERAAGRPFAEHVDRAIARPAGMHGLSPDYPWKDIPHRAAGYCLRDGEIVPSNEVDVSWKLGGGGYVSTIVDLARYAAAIANGELLKRETWAAMWTPAKTNSGEPTGYGLGFQIIEAGEGEARVGHGGAQEETRTFMLIRPETRDAVVIMSNCEYADPQRIATRIMNDALPADER